jgi:DNA-directed RNA polymerase subunit RPC12/RpoP
MDAIKCSTCGYTILPDYKGQVCPGCGRKLNEKPEPKKPAPKQKK